MKGAVIMSKQSNPNAGANRQQRRAEAKRPPRQTSSKPLALRIAIIAVMAVMLLGFFILPLLR